MARLGEIIDGKYEVLREVGRGGMSVVYLAMDKRLNKQWAIKEFRKDKDDASKQVALKALLDEANLMKKLDHPTLPRIVDIIDEHHTVYVVMDYIEGESLNRVLDAYGAQPQEAVIEWAKQLSDVLDYLHTQSPPVIYRDMKPANIMLKPDGTVRLIDFGIAREYKEGKEGDTEAIGTRGYAAPEQFGGKGQTDARTDIYSLGVTLYHLVTGKNPAEPPYEIYPIRHWNPSLSSGLEWLIQKCTQLNPNDRYQSCAEVTYVLENLDKFEGAYKKKQKSRINLFIMACIMTVIFTISSIGCLVGAKSIATNNYNSYIAENTIDGYERALESDDDKPDAYIGMVEKLREQITVIHAGGSASEDETSTLPSNEIMEQDIVTWFSVDRLNRLKENYPEEYVRVNYELGRLFWNNFQGESGQAIESATAANKYFEAVITTAQTSSLENGGLSDQKYNLAKAYYLVSYFQINKKNLSNQDDGDFSASDAAKAAGIYGIDTETNAIENPYYSFWVTNKELLSLIDGDNDVSDSVKLESLKRLAYIIRENYADFYNKTKGKEEKVDGEEMVAMFEAFSNALSNINFADEDMETFNEIIISLNGIKDSIESLYKVEIEEVK